MSMIPVAVVALSAVTIVSSLSNAAQPSTPRIVEVVATDYAFHAPDSVAAGWVTFRLRVRGTESHQLIIFRIDEGVSLSVFHQALAGGATDIPGITPLGGPEPPAETGGTVEATLRLTPGRGDTLRRACSVR
jgi:hypothetical protein